MNSPVTCSESRGTCWKVLERNWGASGRWGFLSGMGMCAAWGTTGRFLRSRVEELEPRAVLEEEDVAVVAMVVVEEVEA